MSAPFTRLALAASVALGAACSSLPLLPGLLAERDLRCNRAAIRVTPGETVDGRPLFRASGCGRTVSYLCDEFANACVIYPEAAAQR